MAKTARDSRLEFRLASDEKAIIERAAEVTRQTSLGVPCLPRRGRRFECTK